MAKKLDKLKLAISSCESKITYFEEKLNDYNTIGELKSVLNRMRVTYSQFEKIQFEITEIDENQVANRDEFEDRYGKVESIILNKIDGLENKPPIVQKIDTALTAPESPIALKIAKIPLPTFNGEEENWLDFRGLFVDLVHNNANLSPIAKFHYLTTCVRDGKGYKFIQPYPVSGDNYNDAFKSLTDFYDNEVKIQKIHMKKLYDIKKPSENSAASLQSFLDVATKTYNALKSLKVPVEHWDLIICHHLFERLDDSSKSDVITKSSPTEHLTFTKIVEILQTRVRILEAKKSSSIGPFQSNRSHPSGTPKQSRSLVEQNVSCPYCKGNHVLINCPKFKDRSVKPQQRFNFVKQRGICVACLEGNHSSKKCQSVCSICNKGHHELLHFSQKRQDNQSSSSAPRSDQMVSMSVESEPSMSHSNVQNSRVDAPDDGQIARPLISGMSYDCNLANEEVSSQILLATVVVWVVNAKGGRVPCRALLDSGSQANFISLRMSKLLGLPIQPTNVCVTGITDDVTTIDSKLILSIESQRSNYRSTIECLIKPKIAGIVPSHPVKINLNLIPNDILFADPWFYKPEPIDLLIGAELFMEIMKPHKINILSGLPLQNSVFGYVVMGRVSDNINCKLSIPQVSSFHVSFHELNENIQNFWKLESIGSPNNFSIEEKICEKDYVQNVKRDETGRYTVSLPVKDTLQNLGNSSENALRQFYSLEKRLAKNPEIRDQYIQFMNEYIQLNHMTEVSDPNKSNCPDGKNYFMPHHSVLRESSTTTKLRVVFNASSKSSTGLSLNDCLMTGPTIQQDLLSIILRFRKHLIGVTGDITKMYRQILVDDSQQDLQRIWWRASENVDPKCYRLRTVTYGTASAPFLAIRTLFKLADDEGLHFPSASEVLKNDFYVDDVLTGADSCEEASKLINDLIKLLSLGGFDLRKITSNDSSIHSDDSQSQNKSITILGINWDTTTDLFYFSFKKYAFSESCTKRSVLSEIAQLFDPLGFCGPIVFLAKIFMQKLWAQKLDWDEELPSEMRDYWTEFKRQLMSIDRISIPRCVVSPSYKTIELHGFGDASESGYGCCIYIRTIDDANNIHVKFLCSKSRVSPLKTQTIPRLELCAALLLSELVHKVIPTMQLNFSSIHLWTDSEITLYRIRSVPSRFATFVANRVSQIQDFSCPEDWYYVPTNDNPSDMISRGLMPLDFLNEHKWFGGPDFLKLPKEKWPKQPSSIEIDAKDLEMRKVQASVSTKIDEWDAISNCSDYSKLLRRIAIVLRFLDRLKNAVKIRKDQNGVSDRKLIVFPIPNKVDLTATDLDLALKAIVKHIQSITYPNEISLLSKDKPLPKQNKLISLSPFLDKDKILRVGGRLKNANVPENYKHQMLLPASHFFSRILVRSEHFRLLHAGAQALLYAVRERFWLIGGRNLCKNIVKHCVRCIRSRPVTFSQIMGQLPEDRVTPSRPFKRTGIDFCGPFLITSKVRSRVVEKVYICVFVCFTTKATHLELVSDLSTQTFLAALRRFSFRRGYSVKIFSDNATNFVGAKSELEDLRRLFQSQAHKDDVSDFCAKYNMTWHTIPPRSPHFGGLWEAAVKSAKYHLKRVVGNSTYTFEQLYTLVVEIEGCLNSRPIGPMSEDPNDMTCLTPGHFLIGQPITSLPDPTLLHLDFNRLSHFQKMQFLFQTFWDRWSKEYLNELQHKRKWKQVEHEPKINDLVILKEDNMPPLTWPLARIVEVFRGKDGYIRVVSVRVGDKIFKRAIARICPLPLETDSD